MCLLRFLTRRQQRWKLIRDHVRLAYAYENCVASAESQAMAVLSSALSGVDKDGGSSGQLSARERPR